MKWKKCPTLPEVTLAAGEIPMVTMCCSSLSDNIPATHPNRFKSNFCHSSFCRDDKTGDCDKKRFGSHFGRVLHKNYLYRKLISL